MKNSKHIYKHYILFSIAIVINGVALAQSSLTGKITDSKTQAILPNVSVYIPSLQRYALSNDSGSYAFNNLPKTNLEVSFTCIGYKSTVLTINLMSASNLDALLEPSVDELQEVLVTSNYNKISENTPFSANSVSLTDIRKFSSPTIMGNLTYQPGVDKISIGNGIGKPVIRGLSFNQILLYAQGTRVENQQWDDHHDLGLTDVGIANVEIVRGPAALIYGADALGGALIFTDEKPAPAGKIIGDANLRFGSNTLGIDGDIGIKGTGNNGFFYGLRVGGSSQANYIQGEHDDDNNSSGNDEEEEPFAFNSKFNNTVAKFNMGLSKSWGTSKISYSFLKQQIGIIEDESAEAGGDKKEEERDREMESPYQDVSTQIISLENTIITGKSKVNVNVAYQNNDRKEYEPTPETKKELAIGLNLNTITYDVKWTSDVEKSFGFTLGSQGTILKNKNNGKEALVPNADVTDFAGYGLARYDFKKLNLLAGIRIDSRHIEAESYEHDGGLEEDTFIVITKQDTVLKPETDFEKDYTPVSFSLGASYHLNENFTVKLNGATGFSAPNYAQLGTYGKHEGTYRFEIGDENLKMIQNFEGDLGAIWENDFVSFNAAGYINNVQNYVYIQNTGDTMVRITPDGTDTLPIYQYLQNDATLSGGEFGFDFHPKSIKWLDVYASYSIISGKLNEGGNLPYIPSNKLIAGLKLTKNKLGPFTGNYVSFIVSNYAKQDNLAEYELATDGYTLLDVHVGASFNLGKQKASFDIFCTNLLNTGYYNQLSLVKYINVMDMGRNIGFRLNVPFGIK